MLTTQSSIAIVLIAITVIEYDRRLHLFCNIPAHDATNHGVDVSFTRRTTRQDRLGEVRRADLRVRDIQDSEPCAV